METKHGYSQDIAEAAVKDVLESIVLSLASGKPVTIRNFGKFQPRVRKAMSRRNPLTGEAVDVPEKISVGFVAAPALKQRLNTSGA